MQPFFIMRFSIIILIHAIEISSVSSLCLELSTLTTRNRYLQNNLLGMTAAVSLTDCAALCQSYQQCQSFGFEPQTKSCHFHGKRSDDVPKNLISKTNWLHGNMNEWPKTIWGPCADHNCPVGKKCHLNRRTNGQICVAATLLLPNDLCPVPPDLTSAVLSTGGQEIGASRSYTCDDEYLDTDSFVTSAVTTCLPDNTWSPVNLTCSGPYVQREIESDPSYIFHNIETDVLNRLKGSTSSLIFLVKACADCNFLLHENLNYGTGKHYEVVLGGWKNTWSVIVKDIYGTKMDVNNERGLLSCTAFRPFWISWENDIITAGKGNTVGGQELMRWTPDPPMAFNFVSYSSYVNNTATWYFLVQS